MRADLFVKRLHEYARPEGEYHSGWTLRLDADGQLDVDAETRETYASSDEAFAAAGELLSALTGDEFRTLHFTRLGVEEQDPDGAESDDNLWRGKVDFRVADVEDD